MPAQASAAFVDFDGISGWFKNKVVNQPNEKEEKTFSNFDLLTIKGVALVSVNQPVVKVTKTYKTIVTAYSSSVDETDDTPFITASGEYVGDGIVAANFLPFGTKIRIPEIFGDKIFVVKDRMASRHTERVDIWFETKELAKEFGMKNLTIEILDPNSL